MRWSLVSLSVLVTATALTAASPLQLYPYNFKAAVSVVADSSLVLPLQPTLQAAIHAKRARPNTKRKTTSIASSSTIVKSSSAVPTILATITTANTPIVPTVASTTSTANVPISSTSTTAAPTTSAAYDTTTPKDDCSCGYVMSDYGDAYYPLAIVVDFSTVSSIDQFPALGLTVSPGRIGGVNQDDHTTACYSDPSNFRFTSDGIMQMVVPGGQSTGGIITGAEVHSTDTMISGHLSMTSRVSPVHGTCQAMFTYIDEGGYPMAGDEQDIEMLGQTLDEGIVLTNWNPNSYHSQSEGTVVPFPSPPTTAFHNYTIFWPPADASPRQTSYYFDGQLLKTMDQYVSVNPSRAYLNNWSNGQASFTQGPPTDDAVLEVAHLAWYYSTAQVPGLPNGCTMQQACRV
ncbi:hypothetical protein QFC24_006864 [Naganishia onofrii]|uniref:Uncharacterized protein n=1 Tax=Naganishia onofrii TaxID=1851511 RepID=A0ACC2WWY7_9TREE|nr:hypothetical protein QFC24_006864 [Naganishia onofrii]